MMLPLWEGTPQDDRHYQSRKAGLENMQAYRAGTYSVFNRAQTLRPLSSGAETTVVEPELPMLELPETPAEEKQSDPYHDLAAGLLRFYQEYDPYDYRDNMELGETDEDALASLEQQLHDPDLRRGILDTLQSFLDDTDPEEEITADSYDQNRYFFLSHFFRDNYDEWCSKLPLISSGINITRVEVWVTNKRGNFNESRRCFDRGLSLQD